MPFDGRNNEFVTERNGQRGEEILEVGRRRGEDHDVGVAHHGVEVGRGGDAVAVELQIVQIAGVAAVRAQRFEHLGIAGHTTLRAGRWLQAVRRWPSPSFHSR